MRGLEQMTIKEIHKDGEFDIGDFSLGRIGDYYPLDKDTRLEVWITSEDAKVVSPS